MASNDTSSRPQASSIWDYNAAKLLENNHQKLHNLRIIFFKVIIIIHVYSTLKHDVLRCWTLSTFNPTVRSACVTCRGDAYLRKRYESVKREERTRAIA